MMKQSPSVLLNSTRPCKDNPQPNSVGIVMPMRDGLPFFKLAFHSVLGFTDYQYTLTIIDNLSGFRTKKYLYALTRNHPINVLRYDDEFNFSAEVNLGIRFTFRNPSVKYGLILNADVVVEPHWLSNLVEALESREDQGVGLAGPVSNIANQYQSSNRECSQAIVPYLSGFCLIFKREVFEKVGGFDEGYTGGCYEDRDFCERAKSKSYQCLVDRKTYVHHFWRGFRGHGIESDLEAEKNKEYFYRKFPKLKKEEGLLV